MSDAVAPTKHASVFISFAKHDEAIADYVQNALNKAGYQASTFTMAATAGDRWISQLSLSLESADAVVILISKAATESHWVLYEVSASIAAVEMSSRKRIIPIALSGDLVPSGVLAQYQWVFTTGEPQEVADAVIRALEQPSTPDKALERTEVLLKLERVQAAMDAQLESWEERTLYRNSLAARWLTLVLFCTLLVTVVVVFIIFQLNSSVIAAVAGASGIIFGAAATRFGAMSSRDFTRDRQGESVADPIAETIAIANAEENLDKSARHSISGKNRMLATSSFEWLWGGLRRSYCLQSASRADG